jgi:hypothetical protein
MARLGSTGGSNALRTSTGASVISAATYVSLHTADPTTSGGSEATGGSPAYARKSISWGTPTFLAGTETVTSSVVITFDVPAGTYAYFGLWDASTGGNYLMGGTCTSQTFSGQGQYQIASGQLSVTATA